VSGDAKPSGEWLAHGPTAGRDDTNPFSMRQLARIDEALTLSSRETGLTFSVYVGELAEPSRATAEGLFGKLATDVDGAVLVAVSPGQRRLHIVTVVNRRGVSRALIAPRLRYQTAVASCRLWRAHARRGRCRIGPR